MLSRVRPEKRSSERTGLERLTVFEIERAEHFLVKYVQSQHFSKEIDDLRRNGKVLKSSHIYRLDPILSDG